MIREVTELYQASGDSLWLGKAQSNTKLQEVLHREASELYQAPGGSL